MNAVRESALAASSTNGEIVIIDPTRYAQRDSMVHSHPCGSFFATAAWARVLSEAYRHQPFFFCRLAEGEILELFPVMEVSSPWNWRRGVSLPFSDFCPVIQSRTTSVELYDAALRHGRTRGWKSLESRGRVRGWDQGAPALTFYAHILDLARSPEQLLANMDGAVRRGIRKATAAGLQVEFSNTLEAVNNFYHLHCRTRKRHGLPPQPFYFFQNIARHVLQNGLGFVATARQERKPLAAAIFFHHGEEAIYKFGASDFSFQHLRSNHLLMWKAIQYCAAAGFNRLHLGRTSKTNEGLRRFKLSFGACESILEYFKYDFARGGCVPMQDRAETWVNHIFRRCPIPLLRLMGEMLYPHLS